ncbi:hypothetical protein [Sinorhizobium fredii]|uniref:Uncharacterized protein n=1 Tax=Rhizobium fredii TaxID=380 RepID=A0A2L0HAW9_RHIFR|nr:hypothetical protein [Sinorhizobium fredii]AUX78615.1 hypothetical protein NXT3_PA00328 [Sinorhizobium fredii]
MIARVLHDGLPSSGLYVSPVAWLLSTQINYMLPGVACRTGLPAVLIAGLALALVSAFSAFLSWRAWLVLAGPAPFAQEEGRPHGFVALLGTTAAVLFTLVILLHASANLFLTGCER